MTIQFLSNLDIHKEPRNLTRDLRSINTEEFVKTTVYNANVRPANLPNFARF